VKIELEISDKNESTSYPWWTIIDPTQMMKPDPHTVVSMISGPFFSREEADRHLEYNRHHYSDRAIIFCHSGYTSISYRDAIDKAGDLTEEQNNVK